MPAQNPSDRRRVSADVTANKTLTAADCGIVQNVIADGVVFTLPASAAGLVFTFRNGGLPVTSGPVGSGSNKSVGFTVNPQAADGVSGNGFTAAVNKGVVSSKANSMVGDEFSLQAGGASSVTGWVFEPGVVGAFTRVP